MYAQDGDTAVRLEPAKDGRGPAVTYGDLWQRMLRIEAELDVLKRQIGGVYYWPLLRWRIVTAIGQRFGLWAMPEKGRKQVLATTLAKAVMPVMREWSSNPWRIEGKFDSILRVFQRKHVCNGKAVDIYTHRLLDDPVTGRMLVLDASLRWDANGSGAMPEYFEHANCVARSLDVLQAVATAVASADALTLLADAASEKTVLDTVFRREFDSPFPFSAANLAARCALFRCGKSLAKPFIKKSGAKRIFVTGNQSQLGLTVAAQELGLEFVELQHALISDFHPVYHFPGRPFVPYAPDRLLLFGTHWIDSADLPQNTKVDVVGFDNVAIDPHAPARRPRSVLVCSQITVGKDLLRWTIEAARRAPDWHFIFRPHPWDQAAAYRVWLDEARDSVRNIEIADAAESIYRVLPTAEIQIGVYSTSLFEGMGLGVRTIVAKLPGWEYLHKAIEAGNAALAESPEEIVALLDKAPVAKDPERYYAKSTRSLGSIL